MQVAKDGKLQPADYSGGTFTITNVGVFGIDAGTPIINGNESAIFCMGSIQRRPWVVGEGADERVEPRWVTTLAVAFDHRIIDGEQGRLDPRRAGAGAPLLTPPKAFETLRSSGGDQRWRFSTSSANTSGTPSRLVSTCSFSSMVR